MKIGEIKEKIEALEELADKKGLATVKDRYYSTMWAIKCKNCNGNGMYVYEQPLFNTYHSQTLRMICWSCGVTVREITIPGNI